MIYDEQFLKNLDLQKNRIIYAKIIAYNFNEEPIESIQGKVVSGTININGDSSVRRACSLSLISKDKTFNDCYWALNSKFKLEIGIKNDINKKYPEIIWFEQGIFVITNFSTSLNLNNRTINISGKDKMCLLNGEVGGIITALTDFSTIEKTKEDGTSMIIKYPIKDIIRESVHTYGGEPFHNIIINDIEDFGLELLEYRYNNKDLYLFRKAGELETSVGDDKYENCTLNDHTICYINGVTKCYINGELFENEIPPEVPEGTLNNKNLIKYDSLTGSLNDLSDSTRITFEKNSKEGYYVARITNGDTAGYRLTELVYPGELIANPGDCFTSVLDKIKNMLTNFEYFYDVKGRFVFQKKKNYLNTRWSPLINNEDDASYVENIMYSSSESYNYDNNNLIVSLSNTPDLLNLKNDYSVWGNKKSLSNKDLPIHMRYAIDEKPKKYTSINVTEEELIEYNKKYDLKVKPQQSKKYSTDFVDWREIIYQMALDYSKFNHLDNFELKIIEANSRDGLYQNGVTGYEQYYIDLLGFWRELYNPQYSEDFGQRGTLGVDKLGATINPEGDFILGGKQLNATFGLGKEKIINNENNDFFGPEDEHPYWAKKVYTSPETLNFWFDFLDGDINLNKYSNKILGNRPKVIKDKDVKAIYFKETPDIIFITPEELKNLNETDQPGYRYLVMQNTNDLFKTSNLSKSAKDAVDDLLYSYSYCSENSTISTIPIYHLDVNTRISLNDKNDKNVYLINKITIPLTEKGNMTINARKIVKSLE